MSSFFKVRFAKYVDKENIMSFIGNYWEKNQFMRIVKRFKSCEGALTNSFLKKNY